MRFVSDRPTRHHVALPERGVEISVLDWGGDGPPALLHHANGFCAALWAPCAEFLRRHYRLIAMDARGHGDSSKPEGAEPYGWGLLADDVLAVADQLLQDIAAERFALGLGHSFGGTLTLAAAARRPGLFERVFLIDPVIIPLGEGEGAFAAEQERRRKRGNSLGDRTRRRRNVWDGPEAATAYLRERDLFANWTDEALDLYVTEGMSLRPDGRLELKCPREVEAAIFDGGGSLDIFREIEGMETPTRLLWARRGDFPLQIYEMLASRMRAGSIEEADIGHLAPMEEPEFVCDTILRASSDSV